MATLAGPFRRTYTYLQRQAHESPVIFYSCVIGLIGPAMVLTVPPLRESWGYKSAEMVPAGYPLPKRARRPTEGYGDPAPSQ
ncbi:hypothetical protein CPB83DRAFT_847093 [Crepidotus variabilis]|uniref:NADH-ubiquinone oxidoreductase 9.5 kDa subunit n=1 Tax=Crepidotus variabilis TaxID=179855 RepID=A0A9P6JU95_9AGAR|nr:hypothetical protein CPB83DRAFT_847093 [Crepidotus variabilis]